MILFGAMGAVFALLLWAATATASFPLPVGSVLRRMPPCPRMPSLPPRIRGPPGPMPKTLTGTAGTTLSGVAH